jgi:hypothetical protein
MVDEKVKIDVPEELKDYLKEKAKDVATACCLFFEYILIPRDNYIEVTSEMKPKITDQMLSYVIQNILGTIIDTSVKYTTNYEEIFKVPDINSEFAINDFFIFNSSQKLRNTLSYLNPTNESIITEKAMTLMNEYLDHQLNLALITLTEGEVDNYQTSFKNIKSIKNYLEENLNTDGDNISFPKNYNFIDDIDNSITQSFVWVLCGLNDWLEKDYVEEDDVKYMMKIMFNDNVKIGKGSIYEEETQVNVKEALFLNDFYTSEKASILMSKLLSNIKNDDALLKRAYQFSIII